MVVQSNPLFFLSFILKNEHYMLHIVSSKGMTCNIEMQAEEEEEGI